MRETYQDAAQAAATKADLAQRAQELELACPGDFLDAFPDARADFSRCVRILSDTEYEQKEAEEVLDDLKGRCEKAQEAWSSVSWYVDSPGKLDGTGELRGSWSQSKGTKAADDLDAYVWESFDASRANSAKLRDKWGEDDRGKITERLVEVRGFLVYVDELNTTLKDDESRQEEESEQALEEQDPDTLREAKLEDPDAREL